MLESGSPTSATSSELRPDFVKLDISMVRRVNAHLGRQAMVVGMRHFSHTVDAA